MAFCTKCGTALNNPRFFCPSCGAKINTPNPAGVNPAVTAPQTPPRPSAFPSAPVSSPRPVTSAPAFQPAAPVPVAQPVKPASSLAKENPAKDVVRKFAKSPLYLAGTISFSVSFIISLILLIGSLLAFRENIEIIRNYIGQYADDTISTVEISVFASSFLSLLPFVLIITGMWIIFASSMNKNRSRLSPAGFTVLKIGQIVQLIFFCIFISLCIVLALGALILMASLPSLANNLDYSVSDLSRLAKESDLFDSLLSPVLIAMEEGADYDGSLFYTLFGILIGLVAVAVTGIIFFAKTLSSVTIAKRTLRSDTEADTVSVYVAVIAFLLAVCSVVLICLNTGNVIFILSAAFFAVSCACFGALIFLYNNAVKKVLPAN